MKITKFQHIYLLIWTLNTVLCVLYILWIFLYLSTLKRETSSWKWYYCGLVDFNIFWIFSVLWHKQFFLNDTNRYVFEKWACNILRLFTNQRLKITIWIPIKCMMFGKSCLNCNVLILWKRMKSFSTYFIVCKCIFFSSNEHKERTFLLTERQ